MKCICYIFFILFCINSSFAWKYKLIATTHASDNSKDCSVIGDCISSKAIRNDTLQLTLFIDNKGGNLQAYRHSFIFRNSTLSFNLSDTNRIIRTTLYNKSNHNTKIYITRKMTFYTLNGGPDIQRIQYTLTGFRKIPKNIKLNDSDVCDCPTKPVRFEIWKNDTINMINANGYKQGNWLEFYDTGEILLRREYKNGQFVVGYNYDKKGKAT